MRASAIGVAMVEAETAALGSGSYISRCALSKAVVAFLRELEREGNMVERVVIGWVRRTVERWQAENCKIVVSIPRRYPPRDVL